MATIYKAMVSYRVIRSVLFRRSLTSQKKEHSKVNSSQEVSMERIKESTVEVRAFSIIIVLI